MKRLLKLLMGVGRQPIHRPAPLIDARTEQSVFDREFARMTARPKVLP